MTNKYEQIVLEQLSNRNQEPGIFKKVIDNLVSAFSDTGALGTFTDIITGDRGAKQYTADPVGQRIYKEFIQPAVASAKSGDLQKSFQILDRGMKKINFYIGSYKLNLRKYINDPNSRNIVDKTQGYAWYPEQVIGMPFSKSLSRVSALGKSGYERFPMAVEFQDSIKQGVGAICSGAQIIIGMRFDEILSDEKLANQTYLGLGRLLQSIEQLSSIQFSVRSTYSTYTSFDVEFELSDLISDVNKDNQNVVFDLIEFMKLLKGASKIMGNLESEKQNFQNQQNNDNIDLEKVTTEVLKKIAEMANGGSINLILTEEDIDEQSVVGNIAGYSLPLGASNQEDPDKEMDDTVKGKKSDSSYKWDELDVSTANISDDYEDSVKKGSKTLFKSRKPRS